MDANRILVLTRDGNVLHLTERGDWDVEGYRSRPITAAEAIGMLEEQLADLLEESGHGDPPDEWERDLDPPDDPDDSPMKPVNNGSGDCLWHSSVSAALSAAPRAEVLRPGVWLIGRRNWMTTSTRAQDKDGCRCATGS
jgi:hypothetical protein